jgi:uncharacterized membrane protein YdbT with pleckstrin-like domain
MLYVQQSLGADEEIIHIGQFHWMYTVGAVMNIVYGFIACILVIWGALYFQKTLGMPEGVGIIDQVRALHPGVRLAAFMMFVLGVLRFAQMMVVKATTEIAVTTSRLVYKRGLVARYVGEMSIDRIEGVNVLQTILGRIFGYGRLMVRGMGVGEVVLPPLANPIAFRKSIEKARTL